MKDLVRERLGGIRVNFYIQPKAKKNEIVGPHNGAIKVKIAAPPIDGRANEEIVSFLQKLFGVTKSQIHIVMGESSRLKVIDIEGITLPQALVILQA